MLYLERDSILEKSYIRLSSNNRKFLYIRHCY